MYMVLFIFIFSIVYLLIISIFYLLIYVVVFNENSLIANVSFKILVNVFIVIIEIYFFGWLILRLIVSILIMYENVYVDICFKG
jgi:hypothetical protein